jgi:hypothetical protein
MSLVNSHCIRAPSHSGTSVVDFKAQANRLNWNASRLRDPDMSFRQDILQAWLGTVRPTLAGQSPFPGLGRSR